MPVTSLIDCAECPRLVALREAVRRDYPSYHAAPVPGWIVRGAQLLIIGLAPGMHGANATGRPFTGDSSGVFLFAALHRAGFASHPSAADAVLQNTSITNAVKCLPPSCCCSVSAPQPTALLRWYRSQSPINMLGRER